MKKIRLALLPKAQRKPLLSLSGRSLTFSQDSINRLSGGFFLLSALFPYLTPAFFIIISRQYDYPNKIDLASGGV